LPAERLAPRAILANQEALNDLHYGAMLFGLRRRCGSLIMCGCDIGKQVAHILCADDLEISQCQEERFAYAKGGHALRITEPCVFCHLVIPFDHEGYIASSGFGTDASVYDCILGLKVARYGAEALANVVCQPWPRELREVARQALHGWDRAAGERLTA
jgi:hypothetical protein